MRQQNFKQYAFTLMELLLVLLLISGILFAGRVVYQKSLLKKDIAVVQQDVEQLFNILDRSYFTLSADDQKVCSSKINNSNITENDWKLILPSNLVPQVETPPHPNFIISCENLSSDTPAQLIIKTPLNVSTDQLSWYAQRLGGVADDIYTKWQKIPTFTHEGKDPLWILSGELEEFKTQLNVPTSSMTIYIGPSYRSQQVVLTYDAGSGLQTTSINSGQWNTYSNAINLPTGTTSISIIGATISCGYKVYSSLAPVGTVYLTNNHIDITFNLNTSSSASSSISPSLSINSQKMGVFTPTTFQSC
jgi:hypothetical protein